MGGMNSRVSDCGRDHGGGMNSRVHWSFFFQKEPEGPELITSNRGPPGPPEQIQRGDPGPPGQLQRGDPGPPGQLQRESNEDPPNQLDEMLNLLIENIREENE